MISTSGIVNAFIDAGCMATLLVSLISRKRHLVV